MTAVRWIEDHPYGERTPFWTRANVGEVLPDPASPAGWDLVWDNGGIVAGWRDCAVQHLGIQEDEMHEDPNRSDFVGLIGGYGYLGATFTRIWAERTPGMTAEAVDQAYYGDHPDVPPYVAQPWHQNEHTTQVMEGWLGWVMGTMDQGELEEQRLQGGAARDERPNLATLSDQDLIERAAALRPTIRQMFRVHINQSAAASIGPGVIGAVCTAVGKPEATMRILAGLGGVDSAAPSYALWELSRSVRDDAALSAEFDAGIDGLLDRAAPSFVSAVDDFLVEFGSRGPNEWDIISDTWETNPELALVMIDRMRLQADDEAPLKSTEASEVERLTLTAEIAAMVEADPEAHGQFMAAVASAGVFVPGRERAKTTIIRVVHEVRMAIRELGRRTVARGQLADEHDVFFLFGDELTLLASDGLPDVAQVVADRREHFEMLSALEPPFIINGAAPPHSDWARRDARQVEAAVAGEVLQGMPGCAGIYRGRAKVVLDPSDPFALEPGDVMIAPHTDPAWTPLFVTAAGVVVDVGAALSHAIIVSRELGIPCVVSATDATKKIPDGAIVEVNGDTGQVTVISLGDD